MSSHLRRIRMKMEVDPSNPEHLLTVYGAGNRLVLPAESPLPAQLASLGGPLDFPEHLDGADRERMVDRVIETAPQLQEQLTSLPPETAARLAIMWCHASMSRASFQPPVAECRRIAARADDNTRHRVLAAVLAHARRSGSHAEAYEESEALVASLPEPNTWQEGHVALATEHLQALFLQFELKRAVQLGDVLKKQTRRLGLRRELGLVLGRLGGVHQRLGDLTLAAQYFMDARVHFEALGHVQELARSRHDLAVLDYDGGRLDEARRGVETAVEELLSIASWRDANFGRVTLATLTLASGAHATALDAATEAEAHGRRSADRLLEALGTLQRGRALLALNQLVEAERALTRCHHLTQEMNSARIRGHAARYLGVIELLRAHPQAARDRFRAAWADRQPYDTWASAMLLFWHSRTYAPESAVRRRLVRTAEQIAATGPVSLPELLGSTQARLGPWSYDERLNLRLRDLAPA